MLLKWVLIKTWSPRKYYVQRILGTIGFFCFVLSSFALIEKYIKYISKICQISLFLCMSTVITYTQSNHSLSSDSCQSLLSLLQLFAKPKNLSSLYKALQGIDSLFFIPFWPYFLPMSLYWSLYATATRAGFLFLNIPDHSPPQGLSICCSFGLENFLQGSAPTFSCFLYKCHLIREAIPDLIK